ncbi:MAG: tetratricopeptide repeat protein [Nitrospinae bacterium]|nr:tetratricopeptide repeat protein [Nitrospinota bacterium]
MKKAIIVLIILFIFSINFGCSTSHHYTSYGNRNFTFGRYDESAANYEHALSIDTDNRSALLMAGWSYFKMEKYHDAMSKFETLRGLDGGTADSLEGVGWTYFKLNRYMDSLKTFKKLSEIDRNHTGALEGIAYNYFKLGDLNNAKKYLVTALSENPMSSDSNLILGYIAMAESDFQTAISSFKNAQRLSGKESVDIYVALGNGYFGDKDYNNADYYYNKAIEKDMKSQGAIAGKQQLSIIKEGVLSRGNEMLRSGDYDDAMEEYGKIESLYPAWSEVYAAEGWALFKKGNYKDALNKLEKGLSQYRYSYDIYDGLGWSYLKLGKKSDAEQAFKNALELFPDYYSSQAGLKELGISKGN